MVFSIIILAMSLSIDALVVGMSYGLRKVKIPLVSKLIICLFSILYSGIALILGHSLSRILPNYAAKLIGIVILVLMGLWIILHTIIGSSENDGKENIRDYEEKTLFKFGIKSLGITIQVIKNPVRGDIDKSGSIDILESLLLGLALSIDAIGAGIGSALAGFNSIVIPFSVGLFQLFFLYTGSFLGSKFTSQGKVNSKTLSVLPGILLILLALLRI